MNIVYLHGLQQSAARRFVVPIMNRSKASQVSSIWLCGRPPFIKIQAWSQNAVTCIVSCPQVHAEDGSQEPPSPLVPSELPSGLLWPG